MELIRKDYGELGVFSDPLQQERFSHLVFAEVRRCSFRSFSLLCRLSATAHSVLTTNHSPT